MSVEWAAGTVFYAEQKPRTRIDNQNEIQRLMEDCRNGKVNLILMKSLNPFGPKSDYHRFFAYSKLLVILNFAFVPHTLC